MALGLTKMAVFTSIRSILIVPVLKETEIKIETRLLKCSYHAELSVVTLQWVFAFLDSVVLGGGGILRNVGD
jgi:hypothetical protein